MHIYGGWEVQNTTAKENTVEQKKHKRKGEKEIKTWHIRQYK